jgi:hypothetical protein
MLNETSIGNVSFRNIPAEKRIGLRIGGVGLTLQQNTWNDLVRLAEDVGIVRDEANNNNNSNDADNSNDEKMQTVEEEGLETNEEEAIEESEQGDRKR